LRAGLSGSLFVQFGADIPELILQVVRRLFDGLSIVSVELSSLPGDLMKCFWCKRDEEG
jgi:hypothetical protein